MINFFKGEVKDTKKHLDLDEFFEECEKKVSEQIVRQEEEGKRSFSVHLLVEYVPLTKQQKESFVKYLCIEYGSGRYGMTCDGDFKMIRLFSKYYILTPFRIYFC